MKTLAVYSIKGGVGKTATAVNLAYLSSQEGSRTLLWDLDPQSSATFYLRVRPRIKGGGKRLLKKFKLAEASIRGTDFAGFDLLPGDFSYRKFDLILQEADKAGKQIDRLLVELASEYDLLILDCSPGFSLVTEAILHLSSLVLIPTIPTPLSMRSLELIGEYFQKKALDRVRGCPFFSMVDRRKNLHRTLTEAPPELPFRFLDAIIPYSSLVEQMGIRRNPLHEFAPGSPPAKAFAQLWRESSSKLWDWNRPDI